MLKKGIILLIGAWLLSLGLQAQEVKLFNKDWLVYDQESHQFFPFVKDNKHDLPLHVFLVPKMYTGLFLSVKSTEEISIYTNGRYFGQCNLQSSRQIPVDSLFAANSITKPILISFYGKFNETLLDSLAIVSGQAQQRLAQPMQDQLREKQVSYIKSFFTITLLLVLVLFVIVRINYSKVFAQFFDVTDLLFNYKSDSSQNKVSFESYYFTFALLSSVFFALACASFSIFVHNTTSSLTHYMTEVGYLVFLAVFFYLLKYVSTMLISWLFSIGKYATLHYKIFIKISVIWATSLLFLALLNFSEVSWTNLFLLPAFMLVSLFFLTLTSIKISVLINQVSRVSTLYLISYLCITEWLPYFVILKLYMVYFY